MHFRTLAMHTVISVLSSIREPYSSRKLQISFSELFMSMRAGSHIFSILSESHSLFCRICTRVPQGTREAATFVLSMEQFGSDFELRRDNNGSWGKPAGSAR